jgi:hypothetical protein
MLDELLLSGRQKCNMACRSVPQAELQLDIPFD